MTTKPYRYFWVVLLIFMVACGKQMVILPIETPIPTTVSSPTSIPTSTLIAITVTPSPIPTQPIIPIITPDASQVEKWKEYQTALVQVILPMFSFESVLCEWDILARSGRTVYVWAVCASSNKGDDMRPAVIHLGTDGSVHSVEILKRGSSSSDINKMFPEEAQGKFYLYTGNSLFNGRLKEMLDHLNYRETHPEEPPLIILSAMPTATSTP